MKCITAYNLPNGSKFEYYHSIGGGLGRCTASILVKTLRLGDH
jgi:hypothetical protein